MAGKPAYWPRFRPCAKVLPCQDLRLYLDQIRATIMKIKHQHETRPGLSETLAMSDSYGPFLGQTIAKNEVRRGGGARMR